MPTYVYECRRCGHRFEVLQSITDAPRQRCPQCRGMVRRVITPGGGLIFKGSGFYITDYKRKEERALADRRAADHGEVPEKGAEKAAEKAPEKVSEKASGGGREAVRERAKEAASDGSRAGEGSGGNERGKRGQGAKSGGDPPAREGRRR